MNNRLKEIRSELNLSQEEFGEKIGIKSRAHISALENGKRTITDRIVSDVCREFNVNEDWLRSGLEPMFSKQHSISLDEYAKQKGVTEFELNFIKGYLDIPKDIRSSLEEHFKANVLPKIRNTSNDEISATIQQPKLKDIKTAKTDNDVEMELEKYRKELEAEKKGRISSASGE